jgi:hypothetical protein
MANLAVRPVRFRPAAVPVEELTWEGVGDIGGVPANVATYMYYTGIAADLQVITPIQERAETSLVLGLRAKIDF